MLAQSKGTNENNKKYENNEKYENNICCTK